MALRPREARRSRPDAYCGASYNHTKIHDSDLTVETCGSVPAATCSTDRRSAIRSTGNVSIDGNSLPRAQVDDHWTAGYEHPVGPGSVYVFTDWYYRSKINFFSMSHRFSDDNCSRGLRSATRRTAMTLRLVSNTPTTKRRQRDRLNNLTRWSTDAHLGREVGLRSKSLRAAGALGNRRPFCAGAVSMTNAAPLSRD